MKVVIVGSGYVGLVTGACLAEIGHQVICVDNNQDKINKLHAGILPIYEPGLDQIVKKNIDNGNLNFSLSLAESLPIAELVFIAVGTPSLADGSADLKYVYAVAKEVGQYLNHDVMVVDKSTVPVGTAKNVKKIIQDELNLRGSTVQVEVISNPEFLREGKAIEDFMKPDRIVVGTMSDSARRAMLNLYRPILAKEDDMMFMSAEDAEMTKYAANAMLAAKISFINEIANLCDQLDVDVEKVRAGIAADYRIGPYFIAPGCGYGGSCFPKDVRALVHMAEEVGLQATLLKAVEERNESQKHVLFNKLTASFANKVNDLTVAIWGLAFKPETDDMREASSLVFIEQAIQQGMILHLYDPVAQEATKQLLPKEWIEQGKVVFFDNQYDALQNADALVLVTEWKQFFNPDFDQMIKLMKQKVIIDGRNVIEPVAAKKHGFNYTGIGRS